MKAKTKYLLIGIGIIVISLVTLYFNLSYFKGGFKKMWPSLILLAGVALYLYYFSTKRKGAKPWSIFAASFLAVVSVAMFILTFTAFRDLHYLWPSFILAFGLGALSLYIYGEKKKSALVLATIFITVSFLVWIYYAMKTEFGLVIGIVLLITGAAFLTRGLMREPEKEVTVSAESEEKS